MNTIPRWIQAVVAIVCVAAVVVIAAVLPMLSGEGKARRRAAEQAKAARVFVAVAEDARKAGDLDMAGQAFAQALEKDPGNPDYEKALAEIHAEQILERPGLIGAGNALRLQLEISAQLVDGQPSARMLVAYGKVLMFRGKDTAARDRLRDAVKAEPDLAAAHLFLGEALLRAEEPAQAQQSLERALTLKPGMPLAHWALGKAFAAREKWEEAAEHLDKATKKLPDAAVWLDLGKVQTKREKWKEAEAALSQVVGLAPTLVAAWGLYAKALQMNQKLAPAIGFYTRYYEKTGDWEAYNELGLIYLRVKQYDKAVSIFRDLRRAWQENADVECRLGWAYESMKQHPPALAAFQRCAKKAEGREEFKRTHGAAIAKVAELAKLVTEQK